MQTNNQENPSNHALTSPASRKKQRRNSFLKKEAAKYPGQTAMMTSQSCPLQQELGPIQGDPDGPELGITTDSNYIYNYSSNTESYRVFFLFFKIGSRNTIVGV